MDGTRGRPEDSLQDWFSPSPRGSQGLNSGHQAQWQCRYLLSHLSGASIYTYTYICLIYLSFTHLK